MISWGQVELDKKKSFVYQRVTAGRSKVQICYEQHVAQKQWNILFWAHTATYYDRGGGTCFNSLRSCASFSLPSQSLSAFACCLVVHASAAL